MKRLAFLLLLPLFMGLGTSAKGGDIPRKILGLYNGKATPDFFYSPIHKHAEMPLNYLGLEVIYRDVNTPLPSDEEMKDYRGVITWFARFAAVANPAPYCTWLKTQIEKGKKIVILGEPGIFPTIQRRMPNECRAFFRAFGVEYGGEFSETPYYWEIVYKDPKMVEFERKIEMVDPLQFSRYKVLSSNSTVYLKARRRHSKETPSDLAFITPHGGFVHSSFVFYEDDMFKLAWRINPFLFFEKAFGVQGLPKPDVTTVNGRRIFYNQIDGDGIFNVSYIDHESFSGEVIYRDILLKYPNLPITASIITAYLDLSEYKSTRAMQMYKNIFNLANIEPASHGYAHPLNWAKKTVAIKPSGYKFSAKKEIVGSVEILDALLKQLQIAKKVNLFLWTGNALPNESDIALTYEARVFNLNGGFGQFDDPSSKTEALLDSGYPYFFPIGILRGPYRQIYASDPNEFAYTNRWKGPYYGFSRVIDSFKNSNAPYRVKPIDVYYHYYLGEREAGLKSLAEIYSYAFSQEIFPMFASEYAAIANDFFRVRMTTIPGGFRITDSGTLKTVRFDRESRGIDMQRSKGVLGFNYINGSLYVALDDAPTHDIYLSSEKPSRPYLANATFSVKDLKGDSRNFSFSKKGWLESSAVFGGLVPLQKYRIVSGNEKQAVVTDGEGFLKIHLKETENNGPYRPVVIRAD